MTTRPTVQVEGIEPSERVRERLVELNEPVLLAFSRGKDSIAAWIALEEVGVEVIPFHFVRIPGIQFVEESLQYYESVFGQHIHRITHPTMLKWLRQHVLRDPASAALIESIGIPPITYEQMDDVLRDAYATPTTWVADGVRAVDSIRRRLSMKKTGPMYTKTRKVHPVWDWRKDAIRNAMAERGVELPVDYELFGRSWDGLQYDFVAPVAERFPEDYEVVKSWFPGVEAMFVRRELEEKYGFTN